MNLTEGTHMRMRWNISAHSIQQRSDQDRFLVIQPTHEYADIVAVFDGHGYGTEPFEVCREILLDFSRNRKAIASLTVAGVQKLFKRLAEETKRFKDSGTTLSLAFLYPNGRVLAASIGDSPLLWGARNETDGYNVSHLTTHNVRWNMSERARVKKLGADLDSHYMFNKKGDGLQMARSLGDTKLGRYLSRKPEVKEFTLNTGEFVFICSDGFFDIEMPPSSMWGGWLLAIDEKLKADAILEKFDYRVQRIGDDATVAVCYLES